MPKLKTIRKKDLAAFNGYRGRFMKGRDMSDFPNFSATGSVRGMKKLYYGKNALLLRIGAYIYNVSSCPALYDYHKAV